MLLLWVHAGGTLGRPFPPLPALSRMRAVPVTDPTVEENVDFPRSLTGAITVQPLGHPTSPTSPLAPAHLSACLTDWFPQSKLKNSRDVRMWSPFLSEKAWQEFPQRKSSRRWSKSASSELSEAFNVIGIRPFRKENKQNLQQKARIYLCIPFTSPRTPTIIGEWCTNTQVNPRASTGNRRALRDTEHPSGTVCATHVPMWCGSSALIQWCICPCIEACMTQYKAWSSHCTSLRGRIEQIFPLHGHTEPKLCCYWQSSPVVATIGHPAGI